MTGIAELPNRKRAVRVAASRVLPDAPAAPTRRALELLPVLSDMVMSDGFARMSVSEMAERLGCSKRTIYELAPSKNELVLRIVNEFFARLRAEAAEASGRTHDPARQIYDYLQVGVRAAQRLGPVAVSDIHKWEPARRIWHEHTRLRVAGLSELIERGVALGAFRAIKPRLVAELAFASISRLREPDFYASTNLSISEAFQEYYRMLLASLVAEDRA